MAKQKLHTTPERSLLMAKIRSKNTKPELRLRKALWAAGLRYRINVKSLPGTPDIVIKKYKLAIFVDGEFWHGKDWPQKKNSIKNNREFWEEKIERNMLRDETANYHLEYLGYTVFRFWDTEINKKLGSCMAQVLNHIEQLKFPDWEY
ncbi:MAG: very short patch repair endonuclease [Edaphocola sp.]